MNKNKAKPKKSAKDVFTPTEVGTLVEGLRSEFKVFGEDMTSLKEDVGAIRDQVGRNFEKISVLEIAVRNTTTKIEALTKSIDRLVQTKADREEIQSLDKRLSILETKVASFSR